MLIILGTGKDISNEITIWNGVVVSPLAPAYEPADKNNPDADDFLYTSMDDGDQDINTSTEVAAWSHFYFYFFLYSFSKTIKMDFLFRHILNKEFHTIITFILQYIKKYIVM